MFEQIIALIAPHKCLGCQAENTLLCPACTLQMTPVVSSCFRCHTPTVDYTVCIKCLQQAPLHHVYTSTMYSELPKRLIHALKFERSRKAAHHIAQYMHSTLPDIHSNTVVCAIPTATNRVRARGYDQAVLIAQIFARQRGLPYLQLLARTNQARQVGANVQERQQQLAQAFRLQKPLLHPNRPILLIDDVITTGSTLRAAAWALHSHGVQQISAAVFARAL